MSQCYKIIPLQGGRDFGTVQVPGSKSITNRAILLAAFTSGQSRISNALFSEDTRYCVESVRGLGISVTEDYVRKEILVTGKNKHIQFAEEKCYVGSAGTTARFLTAMLAMIPGTYYLDASSQMKARPMVELINALKQLGVVFKYAEKSSCLPFTMIVPVKDPKETIIHLSLSCERSSQFLSALLMAAAVQEREMEITVMGDVVAKPYIDITIHILRAFGIIVQHNEYHKFRIPARQMLQPINFYVEPDVSSACYFFSVPATVGGSILVKDIFWNTIQGDIQFLKILQKMGCQVKETSKGMWVSRHTDVLRGGFRINMNEYSDQVITLAVLASMADAPVEISNVKHIAFQESNRVQACITELRNLGGNVQETEDGILVFPASLQGSLVNSHNDHRIAMAFALLGLRYPGITIDNHICCRKTYPDFFQTLETLYTT